MLDHVLEKHMSVRCHSRLGASGDERAVCAMIHRNSLRNHVCVQCQCAVCVAHLCEAPEQGGEDDGVALHTLLPLLEERIALFNEAPMHVSVNHAPERGAVGPDPRFPHQLPELLGVAHSPKYCTRLDEEAIRARCGPPSEAVASKFEHNPCQAVRVPVVHAGIQCGVVDHEVLANVDVRPVQDGQHLARLNLIIETSGRPKQVGHSMCAWRNIDGVHLLPDLPHVCISSCA
mmetsp:Transcript_34710/g.98800  ORF Transcript_34710/g.98800 Transcript_34710/m.98800 type:complete len:232 (+) Transcript_34710:1164-1859(+)